MPPEQTRAVVRFKAMCDVCLCVCVCACVCVYSSQVKLQTHMISVHKDKSAQKLIVRNGVGDQGEARGGEAMDYGGEAEAETRRPGGEGGARESEREKGGNWD